MSNGLDNFADTVDMLVDRAEDMAGTVPGGKPEDATRDRLLEPFLDALGYSNEYRIREASVKGVTGATEWVDYFLEGDDRSIPFMMVEAKSLWDSGIWEDNRDQVLGYLRNYLLTVKTADQAIKWIIVTNFDEWHVLRLGDREPFWSFGLENLKDDEFVASLYERLARSEFARGRLEVFHSEREKTDLGPRFLNDLKIWRAILANGFNNANPDLRLDQIAFSSQQILNRFLFIRILEAYGREDLYSLGNLHHYWKQAFQNRPFAEQIRLKFRDTWASYNTELFDESWVDRLDLPAGYIEPIILPDAYPGQFLQELLEGQIERGGYRSIYNYDFTTLTHDILGVAYEQFLAHDLQRTASGIEIKEDQKTRKKEGIYYTPDYVVTDIVRNSLGPKVSPLVEEAIELLEEEEYERAAEKIESVFDLRILDPACGSGTFLLDAFKYVIDEIDRYNSAAKDAKEEIWERVTENNGGFGEVMDEEQPIVFQDAAERVIVEMLRGVDLDSQAVSLAKLSLWTRLLRHKPGKYGTENGGTKRLPALQLNVRHGNSLVSHDDVPESQRGEALQPVQRARNQEIDEDERIDAAVRFEGLCRDVSERLDRHVLPVFASDEQIVQALEEVSGDAEHAQAIIEDTGTEELRSELVDTVEDEQGEEEEIGENGPVTYSELKETLHTEHAVLDGAEWRQPFHWEIEFPDVFNPDDDPEDRGFDVVIGNPPYYSIDARFGKGAPELRWFKFAFPRSYTDKTDVLFYFLERGTELLRQEGVLSYIVSRAFMQADKGDGIREFLAEKTEIQRILDFLGNRVFDAGIATAIVQFANEEPETEHTFNACSVLDLEVVKDYLMEGKAFSQLAEDEIRCVEVDQNDLDEEPWSFSPYKPIFDKIDSNGKPLGDIEGVRIGQGIQTGKNAVFIGGFEDSLPEERIYSRISNSNIISFNFLPTDEDLLYVESDDDFRELPESIQEYLKDNREELSSRASAERGTCEWYALQHPRKENDRNHFEQKILAPYRAPENRFSVDEEGSLAGTQDTTAIYLGTKDLDWIYALSSLLNSKVLDFRYRALGGIGKLTGRGMFEYFENQIRKLPIPSQDENEEEFDQLAELGRTVRDLTRVKRKVSEGVTHESKSVVSTETSLEEYADLGGPYGDIVTWRSDNPDYIGHLKALSVEATEEGFIVSGEVTENPEWRGAEYEWKTLAEFEIRHQALRRFLLACAVYTTEFDEEISRKQKLTGSDPENVLKAAFRTISCLRFDTDKQRNLVIIERLLDRVADETGRSDLDEILVELQEALVEIDDIALELYDVQAQEDTIDQALEIVL